MQKTPPSGKQDWVVVAFAGDLGSENRCFQPLVANSVPGGALYPAIAEIAERQQRKALTLDCALRALDLGESPSSIILISAMGFGLETLVGINASYRVLYSLESPLQSKRFHLRLSSVSKNFNRAFLFGGLLRYSHAMQSFAISFPMSERTGITASVPIEKRRLLVAVNANKSPYARDDLTSPKIAAFAHDVAFELAKVIYPILAFPNYYKLRREVFSQCSKAGMLDLYGRGWERDSVLSRSDAWRGPLLGNKGDVISGYKFCLCFENCALNGYIPEKIYDCFVARVVPIYCGACDISRSIPKKCYIDFHDFRTVADMIKTIVEMDSGTIHDYLAAADLFLQSEDYLKTDPLFLARRIIPEETELA